jgi:hypothetical protein
MGPQTGYQHFVARWQISATDQLTLTWSSQLLDDYVTVHTSTDQTDPITASDLFNLTMGQGSAGNMVVDGDGSIFYAMEGDTIYNSDWDEYGPSNYHSNAYHLFGAYFINGAGAAEPVQLQFGAFVDSSHVFYKGRAVADPVGVFYDGLTESMYWCNGMDFNRLALNSDPVIPPEPTPAPEEHGYSMYLWIMAAAAFILLILYLAKR